MPSLDDLKKRIKSVKSTQKITKAMKMVAAAKLRKAQENAEKGRPYSQKMQNIILNLTKSINDPQSAPKLLVGTGEDKKYLCVVLTADRGLLIELVRLRIIFCIFSLYGLPFSALSWAFLSLAAATIFIAFVIFCVDLTLLILFFKSSKLGII